METIQSAIKRLVLYARTYGLIDEADEAYTVNALIALFGLDTYEEPDEAALQDEKTLEEILAFMNDYAVENHLTEGDGTVYRDLFDTEIMGRLTPRPSEVQRKFFSIYHEEGAEKATEYFSALAYRTDYIREYRVKRDMKWKTPTAYGDMDVTINLSKPEKDPRAIAAARLMPQSSYPMCLLCHENEGYRGNLRLPPRQNLRQIPLRMGGGTWYMQYSPYVYYNEHCIALSSQHTPMKIDSSTFTKLLDFIDFLPHYFIGSNADLPIVGGSILSHDHMQGGRYTFAMEKAKIEIPLHFPEFPTVQAGIVYWPMSVIRLSAAERAPLERLATHILDGWRTYTDEEAFVYAETDGEKHNTITPIARMRDGKYELDLVLRNNITTNEHPLGLYHPHAELHHIKKENIGLIEVMGLAVLPARLKQEIEWTIDAVLTGRDMKSDERIASHADWVAEFLPRHPKFSAENAEEIIKEEIGRVFVRVLEDAGVYKTDGEGRAAFLRFVSAVGAQVI